MTLNGIPVLNYSVDEKQAVLLLSTNSMEDATNTVSNSMMLKVGVGNDFFAIVGYGTVKRVTYVASMNAYEVVLERESTDAPRITALEAENKKLTAQLQAATEANAFLEECIVEMAGVVYA